MSGFIKYASMHTLSVATTDGGDFKKSAAYADNSSAYFNNSRKIDIQAALDLVAKEYDLSSNPRDYIFEAIRGNTSNVRNENKDAFHKSELLRFDHRIGKQVYRTYELKPHQVNHRNDNPKTARGFIIDAHYNSSKPADAECGNCGSKTASIEARDPETGLHCKKCGHVVKDEYVELLVAIDTKKDPAFANGVLNGVLRHGSMGCSCARTRCNVCNKVAYTANEFCKHIRSKGKVFHEGSDDFNPVAFTIKYSSTDDSNGRTASQKKEAEAFEWCEGVIFEEYSRVHDPADPKAEQYEILRLASTVEGLDSNKLAQESEIMILKTKIAELSQRLDKVASKEADVIVNIGDGENPEDVSIDSTNPIETEQGTPIEEMSPSDLGLTPAPEGEQLTPEAMGIMNDKSKSVMAPQNRSGSTQKSTTMKFQASYSNLQAEITKAGNIRIHDGEGTLFMVSDTSNDKATAAKKLLASIAQHGLGKTINDNKAVVGKRLAQVLDKAMNDMLDEHYQEKTQDTHAEHAEDMEEGRPNSGPMMESATDSGDHTDEEEKHDTKGLKDDALSERAVDVEDEKHDVNPHALDSTEHRDFDMREKRKDFSMGKDTALENEVHDHEERVAKKQAQVLDPDMLEAAYWYLADNHMGQGSPEYALLSEVGKLYKPGAQSHGPSSDEARHYYDMMEAGEMDPAEAIHGGHDMGHEASHTEEHREEEKEHDESAEAKKPWEKDAAVTDKRIEKLYTARMENLRKELTEKHTAELKSLQVRLAKAMKIVAKRQALNLEISPLKEAMGIVLANEMDLGGGYQYPSMDSHTAVALVEAAFSKKTASSKPAWEEFIDVLFERAASIMNMNDESLAQVESDLKNIRTASVVIDHVEVQPQVDTQLQQQVRAGNLQLQSSEGNTTSSTREDRRSTIREALGATKVGSVTSRVR